MMNLRVGVRANRPFILRDPLGLVQILSAHTAWMLLKNEFALAGWKTLCRYVDGTTGWLPVKRLDRFRRPAKLAFEELQTPVAQIQALFARHATVLKGSDQERESVHGLEQLKPLRGVDLPDTIDLEPELSAGMHVSACTLPFSCVEGSFGRSAIENFGHMKLKYGLGSDLLRSLTRVSAAYVAIAHISRDIEQLGPLRKLASEEATIMAFRCRNSLGVPKLFKILEKDIRMLTSDPRCFRLKSGVITFVPSIIAALVLLCGYGPHVRVPSFVLNGDEAIRKEFFHVLNRVNGIPPDSTANLVYTLNTCAAAGVSYMLAQKTGKNKVFIANYGGHQSHRKTSVAFCEDDPFNRGAMSSEGNSRQLSARDPYAYAMDVIGSGHFVDGLARVPIFNFVASPARYET